MVGLCLIGAAALTAVLAAASVRLASLVSTLLAAYLAFVGELAILTRGLSPLREVTRGGLAVAEAVLLAGAVLVWWSRGRPRPPRAPALAAAREAAGDVVTALFVVSIAALLLYELVLVIGAPADNWDSLTYHLARVAAWVDHGGIYWIANAPTPNFNEFPPLAEQQVFFLFVACGSGALFGLPQYLAELAILVAVYGSARRLGFGVRAAACSACLLATFSFVALQATTAQNDLFAASFPAVAVCLVLGGGRAELALAGAAAAMAVAAKPTTLLVFPVLAVLVLLRGRRAVATTLAGAVAGLLAVGIWPYVFNLAHTGGLLGRGGWTSIGAPGQESIRPGPLSSAVDLVYQLMDLAPLSDHLIDDFALAGIASGVAVFVVRRGRPHAVLEALLVALPLVAAWVVVRAGNGIAYLARSWGFPVRGHLGNVGPLNRVIESSAFGPLGAVVLLVIPVVGIVAFARRRGDARHLALACAFPLFLILLAQAKYNWFLTRFLLVPAVVSAPLFAYLFRSRFVTAAFLVVGGTLAGMVVTQDPARPLDGRFGFGRPWQLTQVQAAYLTDERGVGDAVAAYQRLVPAGACVGAVLDGNEPAYFLSGPRLGHRVVYLPVAGALTDAYRQYLSYVVVSTGPDRWAAGTFRRGRWKVEPLGSYWLLAVAPHAGDGACKA